MRRAIALMVIGVGDLIVELGGKLLPDDRYPGFRSNAQLDECDGARPGRSTPS